MKFGALFFAAIFFSAIAHAAQDDAIPTARNRLVKMTDRGLVPPALTMKTDDSIVFFYNDTSDSLVTLEIDFGEKKTHCASSKMVLKGAGVIRSTDPFGPKEFTSTCFHDPGVYPFTVLGLPGHPEGLRSTITVQ